MKQRAGSFSPRLFWFVEASISVYCLLQRLLCTPLHLFSQMHSPFPFQLTPCDFTHLSHYSAALAPLLVSFSDLFIKKIHLFDSK